MDMKLRAIIRDFITWQTEKDLLKNPLTIPYELAETYLEETDKQLFLYDVMPRSYGIVRWHDNEYEDVVCVDRAKAEEYVRKYNELAGEELCYVDEDICLPLNKA
jgi:hypothetical protein